MTVEEIGADRVVVRMDVPEAFYTPYGAIHGGVIAALMDTVGGMVVATQLTPADRTATHSFDGRCGARTEPLRRRLRVPEPRLGYDLEGDGATHARHREAHERLDAEDPADRARSEAGSRGRAQSAGSAETAERVPRAHAEREDRHGHRQCHRGVPAPSRAEGGRAAQRGDAAQAGRSVGECSATRSYDEPSRLSAAS